MGFLDKISKGFTNKTNPLDKNLVNSEIHQILVSSKKARLSLQSLRGESRKQLSYYKSALALSTVYNKKLSDSFAQLNAFISNEEVIPNASAQSSPLSSDSSSGSVSRLSFNSVCTNFFQKEICSQLQVTVLLLEESTNLICDIYLVIKEFYVASKKRYHDQVRAVQTLEKRMAKPKKGDTLDSAQEAVASAKEELRNIEQEIRKKHEEVREEAAAFQENFQACLSNDKSLKLGKKKLAEGIQKLGVSLADSVIPSAAGGGVVGSATNRAVQRKLGSVTKSAMETNLGSGWGGKMGAGTKKKKEVGGNGKKKLEADDLFGEIESPEIESEEEQEVKGRSVVGKSEERNDEGFKTFDDMNSKSGNLQKDDDSLESLSL